MEREVIENIVKNVLATVLAQPEPPAPVSGNEGIPVGISNRHIHLSAEHTAILFGSDCQLTPDRELKQVGEFAAKETVTLVGPKGVIRGVRVLGPIRNFTQVELLRTDGFSLGIKPPVRDSGDIAESAGIIIVGTKGAVTLSEGVICAARHVHMSEQDAKQYQVRDRERVAVEIAGTRGGLLGNVLVRVSPNFRLELHIDTDEANALGLSNGQFVTLRREEAK